MLHSLPSTVLARVRPLGPLVLALAWAVPAAAQEPQIPFALAHPGQLMPASQVDLYQAPAIDPAVALAEADGGKRRPDEGPRPLAYAVPFAVDIDPARAGTWESVAVGRRSYAVWRLMVRAPGALSVNLGFTRFGLPPGAQLSVYAADYQVGGKADRLRQFTARDVDPHGQLWVPLIPGTDAVVVELAVEERQREQVKLLLGAVNAGFRPIRDILGVSGSCNVDVVCSQGDPYRSQIRSVGVLSINGSSLCSGSLINNTGARRPLFITADHCGLRAGNAASVVVFWNFQNSTCRPVNGGASGADGDGNLNQFNSGSIFLATFSTSDFSLVELDDPPQAAFNVFLAGWDRNPGPLADGAVGIHHPAVAEKRISLSNRATEDDGGTHHRIWWRPGGIGVTEGGSSGSPIYSKQGRFIGQLTGGGSACGVPDSSMWDVYGKLSRSWDGGGSAANRVRDHLDPAGTGPQTFEGRNWNDGGGDTAPPVTSITAPASGATVSGSVNVTASASDNVAVARVELLVDGVLAGTDITAPYAFSWNSNAVPNGSHSLRSRAVDTSNNVASSAEVTVTVSNGAPSPNLALNRPATGSTPCRAGEEPAKAVNGSVSGGNSDKWCSATAPRFLRVDLGRSFSLNRFIVRHAGAGGESTTFNTRAFNIQVSTDDVNYTTVATVTANTASVTTHDPSPAATGRYVRLNVTTPTQTTNGSARIYEFEAYGTEVTDPGGNLALNKAATGATPCNANEGPAKAVNGSVSGGNSDKWCSHAVPRFLQVDLGGTFTVGAFVIRHAGAGGESAALNTRAFDIQVGTDAASLSTVVTVTANTANVSTHTITPRPVRFVRLNVTTPTQGTNTGARIYELEVYRDAPTGAVNPSSAVLDDDKTVRP